jgi:hypothetical protein
MTSIPPNSPPSSPQEWHKQRLSHLMRLLLPKILEHERFSDAQEIKDMVNQGCEILWEWNFWVLVKSPDLWVWLKVFKLPEVVELFKEETHKQNSFYELLEVWKKAGIVPSYFFIPEVLYDDAKYGHPAIQLVDGNSLLGILNKKRFRAILSRGLKKNGWMDDEIDESILQMSDFQVAVILESEGLEIDEIRERIDYLAFFLNNMIDHYIWGTPFIPGRKNTTPIVGWALTQAGLKISAEQLVDDLERVQEYLEKNGHFQEDYYGWNILVEKNGNVYIIDFWVSKIQPIIKK